MIGKPRPARWSGLTIALHWSAAAIILALIALGWTMVYGGLGAARTFDLYQAHKSFGFVALALTAARLGARVTAAPLAPFSRWERRLAAITQSSLYVLTIGAIVSGWFVVSASPLPIPTRFFNLFVIPNIAQPDATLFAAAALTHKLTAWSILFLVALHAAGALKHHLIDRDDVLMRMLPRWPGPKPPRRSGAG